MSKSHQENMDDLRKAVREFNQEASPLVEDIAVKLQECTAAIRSKFPEMFDREDSQQPLNHIPIEIAARKTKRRAKTEAWRMRRSVKWDRAPWDCFVYAHAAHQLIGAA